MKKWIFLTILLVFITSCTSQTGSNPTSFHVGSQGVEMNFFTGNPPSKIYKGEPLPILIELKNKGAYPSQDDDQGTYFDGRLYLYGYDSSIIDSFFPKQLPSDFYGKDSFNNEGGYTSVSFESAAVRMPVGADTVPQTIFATVCYNYKTTATPIVCVDPDPYSNKIKNKACTINQVSMTSTQGGPVAVSRVEEDVLSNKLRFKISVSNVGGGTVIDLNQIQKCPYSVTKYYDTDTVYVSGEISGSNIYCPDGGKLRLSNGAGSILCDANKPMGESAAYKTPLKIKLDYAYMKSIQTSITVINNRMS